MALPDTLISRLIQTVKDNELSGRFLMLGRQRYVGTRKGVAAQLLPTLSRNICRERLRLT